MTAAKLAMRVAALETEMKERVTLLEAEVTRLKASLNNGTQAKGEAEKDWLDDVWGSFADDPDYDKAMELGRKYRESLRPKPQKRKTAKR